MTFAYPHIAEQLFGRAHAIEPNALRAIIEGPVGQRLLAGERIDIKESRKAAKARREERMSAMIEAEPVRSNNGMTEYALTREGVAIMSIAGALSKRFDWIAAACGFTTYEGISASIDAALSDYRVRAILFDVDSPGGSVDSLLDLADKIMAARQHMPIWAVANSVAASAAYILAGSAEKLFLPRLALVGSLGAVMIHTDRSAQDKAQGLKYTAKFSGKQKINGWDHAALSPEADAWMQDRVDHCRQSLAELVGRQGRMTSEAALATEAAVYSDSDAVEIGLADGIATFEDALAELTDLAAGRPRSSSAAASAGLTGGPQPMKTQTTAATAETDRSKLLTTTALTTTGATTTEQPAAAATAPAAEMPEKDDEKCPTCNGSGKKAQASAAQPQIQPQAATPAAAAAPADGYTAEMAAETLELCAIAGIGAAEARKFVTAKTPIDKVRADLAAAKAHASDAVQLSAAPPAGSAESQVTAGWDAAIAAANKLNGIPTK